GLYIWNRRHNVSPHEPEGSGGLAGMVMSALSAPIYARSLMDAVLRRKSGFVVTPKGDSSSPDTLFGTFRIHLFFIFVFGASMIASFFLGHSHPAMVTWATLALLITAAPIIGWRYTIRAEKKKRRAGGGSHRSGGPAPEPRPQPLPGAPGNDQTMQIARIALGGRKK
ncbi:glycosyl transferase, partial [Streptomyces sp. SID7499]|nr:glycosyl transferase [Streptomyces sp. SID7499]